MTSATNTWQSVAKFRTRSLAQLADEISAPPPDLMQGLVAAGSLTVFRTDPGVQTEEFMYLLAQCLAVKRDLGPFVVNSAVKVNLFVSNGTHAKDAELAGLLERRCDAEVPDHESAANLSVYHRHAEHDPAYYLDTQEGQKALLNSLLPDCEVVMLDDVAAWLSPKHIQSDDAVPLSNLCEALAEKGVALVLFEKSRNAAEPFRAAYRMGAQHLVRLVKDSCAPVEVGGGFFVVRERMRYSDKVPAKIQWWFTVIDDQFRDSWQWPDPENPMTPKQTAIAERRIQVEKLYKDGLSQMEIAAELGIKQWTVSRDLATITEEAVADIDAILPAEPPASSDNTAPVVPGDDTWD